MKAWTEKKWYVFFRSPPFFRVFRFSFFFLFSRFFFSFFLSFFPRKFRFIFIFFISLLLFFPFPVFFSLVFFFVFVDFEIGCCFFSVFYFAFFLFAFQTNTSILFYRKSHFLFFAKEPYASFYCVTVQPYPTVRSWSSTPSQYLCIAYSLHVSNRFRHFSHSSSLAFSMHLSSLFFLIF